MKFKVEESKPFEPVVVPDDVYEAEVKSFRKAELKFGTSIFVDLTITKGKYKGRTVSTILPSKITPTNKFGKFLKALGKKVEAGATIDTEELVGEKLRIVTEAKEIKREDGSTYEVSRVTRFLKLAESDSSSNKLEQIESDSVAEKSLSPTLKGEEDAPSSSPRFLNFQQLKLLILFLVEKYNSIPIEILKSILFWVPEKEIEKAVSKLANKGKVFVKANVLQKLWF